MRHGSCELEASRLTKLCEYIQYNSLLLPHHKAVSQTLTDRPYVSKHLTEVEVLLIMASNTLLNIYTTPAGPPPPGQTSNLKDPYYRHTLYLVTMSLCLSVSSIVVVSHIFTRSYVMKQVRAEDCQWKPVLSHRRRILTSLDALILTQVRV